MTPQRAKKILKAKIATKNRAQALNAVCEGHFQAIDKAQAVVDYFETIKGCDIPADIIQASIDAILAA